jgi:hypothetical protein
MTIAEPNPPIAELVQLVRAPHDGAVLANKDKNGLMACMVREMNAPACAVKLDISRGTGKTTSIAMFAVCAALAGEGKEVIICVPGTPQRADMLQLVVRAAEELKEHGNLDCAIVQSPIDVHTNVYGVNFRGPGVHGRVQIALASNVDRDLRGARAHLTLVDEYAYVPNADAFRVFSPHVFLVGTPAEAREKEE